jgi:conjugative transfer pilus assembly protein TraH
LKTISEQLESIITEMFGNMDAVNQSQMNSCKISTAIGEAIASKGDWDTSAVMNAAGLNFRKDNGKANDDTDASNQGKTESAAAKASTEGTTTEQKALVEQIVQGNIIFDVLAKNNAKTWVDTGSGKFIEQVMSITGTTIVCVPGKDAGCPGEIKAGQVDAVPFNREPILKFRDFVEGSSAGREIEQYRCDTANTDESKQCLNPVANKASFEGVKDLLRKKLCGDTSSVDCSSSTGGFIGRYRLAKDGGAVSDEDKKLMGALGNYTGMIMNITAKSEMSARGFVDAALPSMSAMVAFNVVAQALNSAQVAAASYKGGANRKSQELIAKAALDISADYKKYTDDTKIDNTSIEYYERLLKASDKNGDMVLPVLRN